MLCAVWQIQAVAAERLQAELESLTTEIESRLSSGHSSRVATAATAATATATPQLHSSDSQHVDLSDWGKGRGSESEPDQGEASGGAAGGATVEGDADGGAAGDTSVASPCGAAEFERWEQSATPKAAVGRTPSPGHPLPPPQHLFRTTSDGGSGDDDVSAHRPDAKSDATPNVRTSAPACASWARACATASSSSVDNSSWGGEAAAMGTDTDRPRRAHTMCVPVPALRPQKVTAPGRATRLGAGAGRRWSSVISGAVINTVQPGESGGGSGGESAHAEARSFDELCNATADSIREGGGGGEAAGLATMETMRRALVKIQGKKVLPLEC